MRAKRKYIYKYVYRKIFCVRQRYSLRLFSADISKITFRQKIPHEIFLIFGRLGERGCVLADHGERKSNLLGQLLADDLRSLQRGGGRRRLYIYIYSSSSHPLCRASHSIQSRCSISFPHPIPSHGAIL